MYYHHVYHIHAHITCLRSSIVMYMVWFQIAVECTCAARVKLVVRCWWFWEPGLRSAAIVVQRQFWSALDFSFWTPLLKLPQKPISFRSSVEIRFWELHAWICCVTQLSTLNHWSVCLWHQTEMLPCLLVGRTSSTSSCMRCDARYQLTQWSGRWAMC